MVGWENELFRAECVNILKTVGDIAKVRPTIND